MNQIYSIIINPPHLQLSQSQPCFALPETHALPRSTRHQLGGESEVLSPGPVTNTHLHHKENVTVTHPTTLSSELHTVPSPGQDQRRTQKGHTCPSEGPHPVSGARQGACSGLSGSKGPHAMSSGLEKPSGTCWPNHSCTLQGHPWSRKNRDRW